MKSGVTGDTITISYDDWAPRAFLWATLLWGAVGMTAGLLAALQLAWWPANMNLEWVSFGRLRPIHTNAVVFAFSANGFFSGMYYSMQRLLKTRMWSDALTRIHFWGWQVIIVAVAVTLSMGISQSKEYAEMEWPIDVAITLIWVLMTINVFATLAIRRVEHLYVAIWFYLASILTIAMLHVVNALALPVSWVQSYPIYAGVQDGLVQWWYGHNAVGFLLTTPFLGLMYYFLPKASGRPVFSYRLSIIHFWSLVFLYIWAGPHHLLYTVLPEWAQSLGAVFSIMLIAPSWGGMLNGLLTLRGAWHKLRTDVVLKFFVTALTFYGMATLEGPLMSLKKLNMLTHFTDYTIAHVHGGALGWLGGMVFGMTYWLVPKLWRRPLYSQRMANIHFWLFAAGLVLYVTSMWSAGITQGLMWFARNEDGLLKYPQFLETTLALKPLYWIRAVGGSMYLAGALLCIWNVWKTTMRAEWPVDETIDFVPERQHLPATFHERIEHHALTMTVFIVIVISIGGLVEFLPAFLVKSNVPTIASVKPYSPMELHGRDIYVSEGCHNCHSQMVRPIAEETMRYGPKSEAGEFIYDHPFQFGSKRTGPDLARVGGKYPDFWHYRHMMDPRSTSPGSIMPSYPWLAEKKVDLALVADKVGAMVKLGVPYDPDTVARTSELFLEQGRQVQTRLAQDGVAIEPDSDLVSLIAYMQRLGMDGRVKP